MHYIWQHIETIISTYKGETPLMHFLKNHYKQHPKLGSRDRKMLSEMAYSYYRCGKAVDKALSVKEKVALCLRMCQTQNVRLQQLIENIPALTQDVSLEPLFPADVQLSTGISREEWLESMLVQPDFFIRVRKNQDKLKEILNEQDIPFSFLSDTCVALPNGTDLAQWLPEFAYVVQDASSQKTGDNFEAEPYQKWWDCCSGAGGKSLLLKDKQPLVDLTVTDARKTILANLKERFRTYSHPMPVAYELNMEDTTQVREVMKEKQFDGIVCDVPCTGSGTWARTPEQMYFFKPLQMKEFAERQKQIALNAVKHLAPGSKLYYITCSVFIYENEEVVEHICANSKLQLISKQLINGTDIKADSMFIAVLQQPA